MCDFCERFDFGSAVCNIDRHGTRIVLAGGSYRFPTERQFNFCPKCGESRDQILAERHLASIKKGWTFSASRNFVVSEDNHLVTSNNNNSNG